MKMSEYLQVEKRKLDKSLGFTIIELLVVLTMVGLVSGVGIFSLINYGNAQTIEQTVGNIKSIFDEAKFNALSSVKLQLDAEGNNISCPTITSYRVDLVPSATEQDAIRLYMRCENISSLIKTYTLPSELNFGLDTTCDEVTYEAVTLEVSALPVLPCNISVEGYEQTRSLTVDLLGNFNIDL